MKTEPRRRSTDHDRRDFGLLFAALLMLAGWGLIGAAWLGWV